MPIRGRIDMLSTGIRTPLGMKIMGSDAQEIGRVGQAVEQALRDVPGARSVFAERTGEGDYLDVAWDREKLARYGITVEQARGILSGAVGGDIVTSMVDGRARHPVNVRYLHDFRSDRDSILLPSENGKRQTPLGELAEIRTTRVCLQNVSCDDARL